MEIKFNGTPHCTLCAFELNSARDFTGTSARRVDVGGVMFCPAHDFAGPVSVAPAAILSAIGYGR